MREQVGQTTRNRKRPSFIFSWSWWDHISAGYGKYQFDSANRFYHYDWRSRTYEPNLPSSWLAYHYATAAASIAAFSVGIGQCLLILWRK